MRTSTSLARVAGLVVLAACSNGNGNGDASADGTQNDAATMPGNPLQRGDLHYLGAFRVTMDGSLDYGGWALGFNPGSPGSLFISCLPTDTTIAEISIPNIVNSATPDALETATTLQHCADPAQGAGHDVGTSQTYIGGMLVRGGRLITSEYLFYDATDSQTAAFYVKPDTNLAHANATGPFTVNNTAGGAGFVDGWMAPVPSAYQSMLGGPLLSGNCCLSVITRTSWGPSAFAWNPDALTNVATPVSSTALLYYTQQHATLGQWNDAMPVNGTTVRWEASGNGYRAGGVIPEGFRSILFFGAQGTGSFCYGCGTSQNPPPAMMCDAVDPYCYDPNDMSKGNHGYPYRYQIMAYDLADLAAVRAGTHQPWEVLPYAIWDLTDSHIAGFDGMQNEHAGGAVYDPATRRIYFAAPETDGPRPLIHVWQVGS